MKKKRSIFNKILYFINSIFALLLLLAYSIPYVKPENLGSFSGISLLTPLLILINLSFLLYWIIRIKRTFLLSFIILAIGYPNIPRLYKITGKKVLLADDIKIMNYNVRMFNKYEWIKEKDIATKINDFIHQKSPDIICFQEYAPNVDLRKDYPYNYIKLSHSNKQFGHAIYSKYRIINKGSLDLKNTSNNIIYADIKIDSDTVRVYNIHLQSLKINPKKENFGEKDATRLRNRISTTFNIQQHQVEQFLTHQQATKYPKIIAGDFNNTAYSWAYRSILKGKNDAFVAAGKGFDKTFDFTFPIRIDFILLDKSIKVNHFKTYRTKYSDHFPIMARIDRKTLLKE